MSMAHDGHSSLERKTALVILARLAVPTQVEVGESASADKAYPRTTEVD